MVHRHIIFIYISKLRLISQNGTYLYNGKEQSQFDILHKTKFLQLKLLKYFSLIYFNMNFNLFFSTLHVHPAIQLSPATQILIF